MHMCQEAEITKFKALIGSIVKIKHLLQRLICFISLVKGYYEGFEIEAEIVNATTLGETTGTADDWALKMGATYAYTIELPPKLGETIRGESSVFEVPRSLILPICARYIKAIEICHEISSKGSNNLPVCCK